MTVNKATTNLCIFTGRFGSGKTEVSINYALALAKGVGNTDAGQSQGSDQQASATGEILDGAILIDLDIVTPYFRSRETAEALKARGIDVIAPSIVGQHLDTPSITPQILGAIEQRQRPAVLDVGGDRQGARALGQYSAAIERRGYDMHFVVNPYRPFTDSEEGVRSSIAEIEASARLQVTSLVSNPNLMGETNTEKVLAGHDRIVQIAAAMGLPLAFVCVEKERAAELGAHHFAQPLLVLDRFFVQPWESVGGD